jgi:hypothetical protein
MLIRSTWGWRCSSLFFNAGDSQLLLPHAFLLYFSTFTTKSSTHHAVAIAPLPAAAAAAAAMGTGQASGRRLDEAMARGGNCANRNAKAAVKMGFKGFKGTQRWRNLAPLEKLRTSVEF